MSDSYESVADQLTNAGYRETEAGCFVSEVSPRVVGLAFCQPDPKVWHEKTEELLRREPLRLAFSWARYVVLLIDEKKTSSLARAAAAFSQDVAKCRRIVLFAGSSPGRQVPLPFLGLPSLSGEIDAPPRDVEVAARSVITGSLADAFLNEDLADTEVLKLAEEEEP